MPYPNSLQYDSHGVSCNDKIKAALQQREIERHEPSADSDR